MDGWIDSTEMLIMRWNASNNIQFSYFLIEPSMAVRSIKLFLCEFKKYQHGQVVWWALEKHKQKNGIIIINFKSSFSMCWTQYKQYDKKLNQQANPSLKKYVLRKKIIQPRLNKGSLTLRIKLMFSQVFFYCSVYVNAIF